MKAVIAGQDADGLGAALEATGATVSRVDGVAARPALEDAGIVDADLFVLTDAGQATAIPVARDVNGGLRIVVYTRDSVPDFARPGADLLVDPDAVGPDIVADELTRSG